MMSAQIETFEKVCTGFVLQDARPHGSMVRRRSRTAAVLAGENVTPNAHGGVSTPPKTTSKSPGRRSGRASAYLEASCRHASPRQSCCSSSATTVPSASAGEASCAALPWAACEAVSAAIWTSARQAIVTERTDDSMHSPKRRKHASLPGFDLKPGEEQPAACSSTAGSKHETLPFFLPATRLSQPSQSSDVPTQLTQPSQPKDGIPLATDAAAVQAHAALRSAWEQIGRSNQEIPAEHFRAVQKMQQAAQVYCREEDLDMGKAAASMTRFLEQQRRLYWRKETWRGVNLGGWLLLEPGPSAEIFDKYGPASCEWDLMLRMREQLGDEAAERVLSAHRDSYITEDDFKCIKALGLNAVRIPFGYWVAMGPAKGDPYAGPAMEHLDRALAWCKAYGLQAVLDLHGAPGGESGERPCGRESKDWHWQEWRFDESVAALRAVATRYRGHPAISGISVCNEPSETVPAAALCRFYDRAVRAIREAGMPPDEVAIILPVYRTERLDQVWRLWSREYDGFSQHANIAFDLHLYHCFGTWWQRQGLANQLRMTKRHRKILRRVPAVVGEWSLALPPQARGDCQLEEDQALTTFAEAQLDAYSQASHGWFFWTWRDSPLQHPGWDLRKCLTRRWMNKNQLLSNVSRTSSKASEVK